MQQRGVIDLFEGGGQVEHIARHENTHGNGVNDRQRHNDFLEKVMQPSNFDKGALAIKRKSRVFHMVTGLEFGYPAVIIVLQQNKQGGNGLEQRQLEEPPDQQQQSCHGITADSHDESRHHHTERDPHVEHVGTWHALIAADVDNELPDGEAQ